MIARFKDLIAGRDPHERAGELFSELIARGEHLAFAALHFSGRDNLHVNVDPLSLICLRKLKWNADQEN
jgi:hypothetical protein